MKEVSAQEFYDKIADKYEKEYKTRTDIAEDRFIMELLNIKDGSNVMDLGCGTGMFLEYHKKYHMYFGIDISGNMIKIAEKKFGKRDFPNITLFETMGIENVNVFEDNFYDYIISLFGSMSYIENIKEILEVAYHKLCKRGKIFTMVYSKGYQSRVRSHNINGGYHIKNVRGYSRMELEGIIRELGFKNYKISGFRAIDEKYIEQIGKENVIEALIKWEYETVGKGAPDLCHFIIVEIRKE